MRKATELLKQKISLFVSLPANQIDMYEAALHGGADVIKVHINVEHRASGSRFGTLEENLPFLEQIASERKVPLGIVPGDSAEKVNEELIESLANLQFDFFSLYTHHTPAWLMNDSRLSRMIAVSNQYGLDQTSALSSIGVDILEASIMPPESYGSLLTAQDLAAYRLLAQAVDKPVVVPTQKLVRECDLEALVRTGIRGIMIGAIVTGKEPESIYRATKRFKELLAGIEEQLEGER
ncbi:hypothetical protein [Paenibacillus chungangensis]|uniref:Uncharacterized protein n=1 Tax=Paenibacillus chungangensis TaxID=696535 RepID=A0ABW3HSJ7_9BACL